MKLSGLILLFLRILQKMRDTTTTELITSTVGITTTATESDASSSSINSIRKKQKNKVQ
jgi:hypothetical protein